MKYTFLFAYLLITSPSLSAQWTTLPVPFATRYDDIFFINDTLGWAVNSNGSILHTSDAGASWTEQEDTDKYLRSIEFATPTLGFCGSLDFGFYRTTDGGLHWDDITGHIDPMPSGICGLAAPTPEVIYGCGVWSSPAFVIKSSDGGTTWISTDMSAHASALVDMYFVNADTGFVCGKATAARGNVGTILYTTNGGQSWTEVYHTERSHEYIWKLQSPDGMHIYGSIENAQGPPTLMARSDDKGLTWTTVTVDKHYHYIQCVGFINTQHGWTGATNTLLETTDGGASWTEVMVGSDYNRFFRLNDTTAFVTGGQLYKYSAGTTSIPFDPRPADEVHLLSVYPNPVIDHLTIDLDIRSKTHCVVRLFTADGRLLRTIYDQPGASGEKSFTVSLRDIASQRLYVSMHTNEGVIVREVVRQ